MSTVKTIVTFSSTGTQGSAFCRQFAKHAASSDDNWALRCVTRDPASQKSQALSKQVTELSGGKVKVEFVRADLNASDLSKELGPHLEGAYGALLIVNMADVGGVDRETEVGNKIINIAAQSGVKHFVYNSVGSAARSTGIPHFDSKFKTEQHLQSMKDKFQYTSIVRPVFFMENLMWSADSIKKDKIFSQPLPAGRKLQMVAADDIGLLDTRIFLNPEKFNGKAIELSSDELTMEEAAKLLGCTFQEGKLENLPNKDFRTMYEWFNRVGYNADIEQCKELLGGKTTSLKEWAQRAGLAQ